MMLFLIEVFVLCVLFTLMIVPACYKDPLSMLYDYPPKIIERVKSLPEYQGKIPENKKKLSTKIGGSILFVILLSLLTYFSGARTFLYAIVYSYGLWLIVDWYDALVMDIGIFAHVKRFRIAGTEDMVREYTNPWFYIKGAFVGMAIGAVVCLLSSGLVVVYGLI